MNGRKAGVAFDVALYVVIVAVLGYVIPDSWHSDLNLIANAWMMGYAFWRLMFAELYAEWTGDRYSVTLVIDGTTVYGESCAFAWTAKRKAEYWTRKWKNAEIEGLLNRDRKIVIKHAILVEK